MRRVSYLAVVSLIALGVSTPAIADVGVPDAAGGIISDVKTPPLQDSQTWQTAINLHNNVAIPNWAGYVVRVHIADGTEVSLRPSNLSGGTQIDLPDSTGNSAATMGWVWGPNAAGSGMNLPASQNMPVLTPLVLHAKGTPVRDSTPDLVVSAWNIKHLLPAATSDWVTLKVSDLIWAPSSWVPNPTQFEWPYPVTTNAPGAGWKHMPFTVTFHFTQPVPGSNFIATLAGMAKIDVTPEPASGLLMLGGIACLMMARRARKRRLGA